MAHFKDLIAWQKAMDLVATVYNVTELFPRRETYSLCDQIRRAAVSVPSNIAEGQAHFNRREFLRYLRHARGSLAEVETQFLIAEKLKYISGQQSREFSDKVDELSRILSGLVNSLKKQLQEAGTAA
ncbi:MAG TPA: four helix bundle protein [Terriglobales bacterium]